MSWTRALLAAAPGSQACRVQPPAKATLLASGSDVDRYYLLRARLGSGAARAALPFFEENRNYAAAVQFMAAMERADGGDLVGAVDGLQGVLKRASDHPVVVAELQRRLCEYVASVMVLPFHARVSRHTSSTSPSVSDSAGWKRERAALPPVVLPIRKELHEGLSLEEVVGDHSRPDQGKSPDCECRAARERAPGMSLLPLESREDRACGKPAGERGQEEPR